MRSNLPRKLLRITVLVALSALAVWRLPGVAAGGTPVYDPKPLMAALGEERAARPFTFAVFGDTYAHEDLSRLMEMVEERGADFAVTTGDLVSFGGGRRRRLPVAPFQNACGLQGKPTCVNRK